MTPTAHTGEEALMLNADKRDVDCEYGCGYCED